VEVVANLVSIAIGRILSSPLPVANETRQKWESERMKKLSGLGN
jgi:hypothetical protein